MCQRGVWIPWASSTPIMQVADERASTGSTTVRCNPSASCQSVNVSWPKSTASPGYDSFAALDGDPEGTRLDHHPSSAGEHSSSQRSNFEQDVSLVRWSGRGSSRQVSRRARDQPACGRPVLGRAGYVCEVLAGSGPLVLVLMGRKLTAAELLVCPAADSGPQAPSGAARAGESSARRHNRGCPEAAGARRTAGSSTGCGAGRAGRPSLPLLFPCPVRAAGNECGGARPRPARVMPSSVPAFFRQCGRSRWLTCLPVHSSVVHSITSRRPGSGVCHLEWDDPRTPRMRFAPARWPGRDYSGPGPFDQI